MHSYQEKALSYTTFKCELVLFHLCIPTPACGKQLDNVGLVNSFCIGCVFLFRSFEDHHIEGYEGSKSKYLKNQDDLASGKEGEKEESPVKSYSFVGLIYPNLIPEHCKFKIYPPYQPYNVCANCFCVPLCCTQIHMLYHASMHALSNKMNNDGADGHLFAWI